MLPPTWSPIRCARQRGGNGAEQADQGEQDDEADAHADASRPVRIQTQCP